MKAILEFDLNDQDDRKRHLRAIKADDMYFALFEIVKNMRKNAEWTFDSWSDTEQIGANRALSYIMIRIEEQLDINNININELE